MKKTVVLLAAVALSLSALPEPVSVRQAASAARAWAGAPVERASSVALRAGASVYAVKVSGGGTLFMSPDTSVSPVVAFTAATNDFSSIDVASPLWALLSRDAEARAAAAKEAAASSSSSAAKAAKAAKASWAALLADVADAEDGAAAKSSAKAAHVTSAPSDLRVSPLVRSQWDQGEVRGLKCYNRFTPTLASGESAFCGCVATAMAQIMRRHEFPSAAVESVTRRCFVDVSTLGASSLTELTTQGGVYDWANMPLVPEDGVTDAQCEAIGKLTSDAGIAACMSYDEGISGAFLFCAAKALADDFGYAKALYYSAKEITADTGVVKRALLSNIDAGYPVLVGLTASGGGGHAVVGDGYGYEGGVAYVHLNMGWSGQCDFWYNLPNVDSYYTFTVFDDMVFNVFPTADGTSPATLSGRVTDEATNALANAAVRVYAAGSETLVASGATTETGVYGLLLPAGRYDLEFESPGRPVERLEGVSVAATTVTAKSYPVVIGTPAALTETYTGLPVVTGASRVGNAWGVDAQLPAPCARIVVGAATNVYATLDAALSAAAAFASAGAAESAPVAVELLGEIGLSATAEVGFQCVIRAAGEVGDAAEAMVVREGDAALSVTSGGALTLSNVVFASSSSAAVTVAAGGCLALGGGVDFRTPSGVAAVRTADVGGFVMADALDFGFSLLCDAADDEGEAFGRATCASATAEACAALVVNAADADGGMRGEAVTNAGGETFLKWQSGVPVPMSEAAAYFVDLAGETHTAATLDDALNLFQAQQATGEVGESGEIVVRERLDLSLTRLTTVAGSLTVRGETSGVTVSDFGGAGGFVVGDGASLTVSGVTFDGYSGNALFLVDGGSLTLDAVAVSGATGTNYYSGAVAVLSGSARLRGCAIEGCEASGRYAVNAGGATRTRASCGGGVYLKGAGASLALEDTSVGGCEARSYGGGVYAGIGSSVTLSGEVSVRGNTSGGISGAEDNLHLCAGSPASQGEASLALSGVVTGSVGVRWRATSGASARAAEGGTFATASTAVAAASVRAFSNDADSSLAAEADSGSLVWAATADSREVDESEAVVRVIPASGGATRHYATFSDAAATLDGDATIELLGDDVLLDPVEISCAVTLRSASGSTFSLARYQGTNSVRVVGEDASLTLSDVVLDGCGRSGGIFLDVVGASLTLESGATVKDVAGTTKKAASAIRVSQRGTLTMESGSLVSGCQNLYSKSASELGEGGGICVDRSTAFLRGGTVTGCAAWSGGGVWVCNKSVAYVSGDMTVAGNSEIAEVGYDSDTHERVVTLGGDSNVLVSDNSSLVLEGTLSGDVGCLAGAMAATNVFGTVADGFSGTDAQLADSAHRFVNDETEDVGIAVKPVSGAGETLLVWSDAIDGSGAVTVNGTNCVAVAGGATLSAAVTGSVTDFTYSGKAQSPAFGGHGFTVAAEAQVNAGSYAATLTPKKGFAWADGTTASRTVAWTIAKAVYDMGGVTFESKSFAYDGEAHSLEVGGTLPDGVTVAYSGNGQTEVGVYAVTASFAGDAANYEAIDDMTATLTIYEGDEPGPEPDPPTPSVETNCPTPIAFAAIERLSEGSWRLVVTNRVPWCWYRLLSTDDLEAGFVTTGEWVRAAADATPAWTNDVETAGAARFWRAEGKEGEVGE